MLIKRNDCSCVKSGKAKSAQASFMRATFMTRSSGKVMFEESHSAAAR